jgi:hypothetical protein
MDIIKHSVEESKVPDFLKIDDEKSIKRRKITKELLLHRTTILYGSPASGKSYIIKVCLNAIQHDLPIVFVISSTAKENKAYNGIAKIIIAKPTMRTIEEIMEQQTRRLDLYNTVNNLTNLKNLYNYCKVIDSNKVIFNECIKFESTIKNILQVTENKFKFLPAEKLVSLRKERDTHILNKYKEFFTLHRKLIITNYKPMFDAQYATWLVNVNIIPNVGIIFDDCVPFIKELNEKKNQKFTYEMMFHSRHKRLTIIVASQASKSFGPQFRQVIHNMIFCDAAIAMQFSDEIKEKTLKKDFLAIVNKVFTGTSSNEIQLKNTNSGAAKSKNPTKFVYQIDGDFEHKFCFLYELTPEDELVIKLGGQSVNRFYDLLEQKISIISQENMKQYYESVKQSYF